jgi:hypothetical protein
VSEDDRALEPTGGAVGVTDRLQSILEGAEALILLLSSFEGELVTKGAVLGVPSSAVLLVGP